MMKLKNQTRPAENDACLKTNLLLRTDLDLPALAGRNRVARIQPKPSTL